MAAENNVVYPAANEFSPINVGPLGKITIESLEEALVTSKWEDAKWDTIELN